MKKEQKPVHKDFWQLLDTYLKIYVAPIPENVQRITLYVFFFLLLMGLSYSFQPPGARADDGVVFDVSFGLFFIIWHLFLSAFILRSIPPFIDYMREAGFRSLTHCFLASISLMFIKEMDLSWFVKSGVVYLLFLLFEYIGLDKDVAFFIRHPIKSIAYSISNRALLEADTTEPVDVTPILDIVGEYKLFSLHCYRGLCGLVAGDVLLPSNLADPLNETDVNVGLRPLLCTNAIGYCAAGESNFWLANRLRGNAVLKDENPLHHCETLSKDPEHKDCILRSRVRLVLDLVKAMFILGKFKAIDRNTFQPTLNKDWVKHFPSAQKRNRALDAYGKYKEATISLRSNCFLKTNEIIWPKHIVYDDIEIYALKPRNIQAVDTSVCLSLQKEVNLMMDYFKQEVFRFNHFLPITENIYVSFVIGSGSNADGLSEWYNKSIELVVERSKYYPLITTIVCIVAGDDFLCVGYQHTTGNYVVAENDFSTYERTQGRHLLDLQKDVSILFGMHPICAQTLVDICCQTPRYKNTAGEMVDVAGPVQRFSGSIDTTYGNTLLNILSVMYSLMASNNYDFSKQSDLGLISKCQYTVTSDFNTGHTFLKGWFVRSKDLSRFVWVPLPSQLIKIGCTKGNPVHNYKTVHRHEAYCMTATGMSKSFKCVDRDYPLFGALLTRYDTLSNAVGDSTLLLNQYKAALYDSPILDMDRADAEMKIMKRYGLESQEILDMEELIKLAPFPGVIGHRGFCCLVSVDYGAEFDGDE